MECSRARKYRSRLAVQSIAVGLLIGSLLPSHAMAAEKVIHSFCRRVIAGQCADGDGSAAGVTRDGAGHLYGVSDGGGGHAAGAIFGLSRTEHRWRAKILYRFCSQPDCTDGVLLGPDFSGLTMDATGTLYGTSNGGGAHNGGVIFTLKPDVARTGWTYKVLYNFCSEIGDQGVCLDGNYPGATLVMDSAGNLYGTTDSGGGGGSSRTDSNGKPQGCGVAFELAPDAAATGWKYRVLYSFCAQPGCADGASPSGLVLDPAGDLYGTTFFGGLSGVSGIIFALTPDSTGTAWSETVLYNFCSQPGCSDGLRPAGGVAIDGAGNLYGMAAEGGANDRTGTPYGGTVFKLSPDVARSQWAFRVLYSFCSRVEKFAGGRLCKDGALPQSGLMMAPSRTLFGTTTLGGAIGFGAVFRLKPD